MNIVVTDGFVFFLKIRFISNSEFESLHSECFTSGFVEKLSYCRFLKNPRTVVRETSNISVQNNGMVQIRRRSFSILAINETARSFRI